MDASISLAPGCDKYFVYLRETFVSRRAAETPEGWRLRERQRPSLLEPSDARADSNRPLGRFRGGAGFRGSREAPVRLEMPLHEHKTFSCGIKRCCDAASETSRGLSPTTIRTLGTDYRPAGQARRKPSSLPLYQDSGRCRLDARQFAAESLQPPPRRIRNTPNAIPFGSDWHSLRPSFCPYPSVTLPPVSDGCRSRHHSKTLPCMS